MSQAIESVARFFGGESFSLSQLCIFNTQIEHFSPGIASTAASVESGAWSAVSNGFLLVEAGALALHAHPEAARKAPFLTRLNPGGLDGACLPTAPAKGFRICPQMVPAVWLKQISRPVSQRKERGEGVCCKSVGSPLQTGLYRSRKGGKATCWLYPVWCSSEMLFSPGLERVKLKIKI